MNIIPMPAILTENEGKFHFTDQIAISSNPEAKSIALWAQKFLQKSSGFPLPIENTVKEDSEENYITFLLVSNSANIKPEGYKLRIEPSRILIQAIDLAGLFYGFQTLRQLLPKEIEQNEPKNDIKWKIPCVLIEDSPRFSWRGFMLDVGRHFQPIAQIKKMLDQMALFKMNRFHFHLTEDQGWRIQINKYPKLTEIGSKRNDTKIGGWLSKQYRGQPHEGFYTQDEIQEIVGYAKERFIEVIPEIELPGHSRAALAAYPHLGCLGTQMEVPSKFGIFHDIYCAGKEETFSFLQNVFDELLNLFPYTYVHIGGDETPKKRWKSCPHCQQRIVEKNLDDEKDLQTYFVNRMFNYLTSKGKKVIGWNEILHPNLNPEAVGQWWIGGKKKIISHLRQGRKIIVSKLTQVYLDYNYVMTPLRKTYALEPIPSGLESKYHSNILGVEAPLWTEWVPNNTRFEWQVFPRIIAVAETAWTQKENKNFQSFMTRLTAIYQRLSLMGIKPATIKNVNPKGIKRFLKMPSIGKWPLV
ncbi:hypothetical protein NEF87_003038 [Candidatus Lokiarchaeum ossiferum]|uniref:beta-N-acetylhexosaminidase n=1 Tax=Candidatus Lokiarchaeum ossiferum TaxID=2951803 RepID=A0ABY6HTA9_9ARCH|nr:hypothetical protein NEF87_003038 [Candidatus Lokiarchaeum sp. B-35]